MMMLLLLFVDNTLSWQGERPMQWLNDGESEMREMPRIKTILRILLSAKAGPFLLNPTHSRKQNLLPLFIIIIMYVRESIFIY
jgi:hypothetical protein